LLVISTDSYYDARIHEYSIAQTAEAYCRHVLRQEFGSSREGFDPRLAT